MTEPLLTDRQYFLCAVILYGISSVYSIFLWRKGFREDNRLNYILLLGSALFHTMALVSRGFSFSRCPVNNLYEAMAFIGWTIVASYLVIGLWSRLRFLGAFASPVLFGTGIFALMPGLDVHSAQPAFVNGWTSLHATLILLSYGAFGLASIAGLMYLTQEHNLKFDKLRAVLSLLPPIQRLELTMNRLLIVGFVLLTIGLLMAPRLMKEAYGVYFKSDPKIIWSIFVWALYLTLLVMRRWFAQGGRRFAWGTVGGFSFVLLTFWGFNLLSTVHNP
ncbi:MAG: cytochrome c biogenesis protein CcsA [Verrucomicrobiota bacterium]|nr:cytochrome c biogenesis protein CcsA [Verrucomicrobiota bacterium]